MPAGHKYADGASWEAVHLLNEPPEVAHTSTTTRMKKKRIFYKYYCGPRSGPHN